MINTRKVLLRIQNGQRRENALTVKTPTEFKEMQLFQNVNIKHDTMEVALLLTQVPGEHKSSQDSCLRYCMQSHCLCNIFWAITSLFIDGWQLWIIQIKLLLSSHSTLKWPLYPCKRQSVVKKLEEWSGFTHYMSSQTGLIKMQSSQRKGKMWACYSIVPGRMPCGR